MSTGKTNLTSTQFSAKKLLGKAHTSNLKGDVNEAIPSNVSLPTTTIFAETIPNVPGDAFYTIYSASVEKVYFDVVSLSDTIYDANDAGGGGDEASTSGAHGFYLKLPAAYETTSSNSSKGSGAFLNGARIYNSKGALQIVPPFMSNASPNKYFLKLYKGSPSNPANEITSGDAIDWQVDYYSGVVFIQDYNASTIPVTASAYLYTGKYLDAKISGISSDAAEVNSGAENRLVTVNADTKNLDAEANLTFTGTTLFLTGTLNVSGTINANSFNLDVVNKNVINLSATGSTEFGDTMDDRHKFVGTISGSGPISGSLFFGDGSRLINVSTFARRAVTTNATASISDRLIGVSASAPLQIRLPNANTFKNGQFMTVKDEAGNANNFNITILPTGIQTIDGSNSIILKSPFAAVNLYSDGTSKFFVF